MEFRQLEMFVALVEAGSVQRAAERVFRTQPAVSMAIRKLEEELGTSLFNRSDRNPAPTEVGRLLFDYATRLLAARDEAIVAIDGFARAERGHLRIGASESISHHLLPEVLSAFHDTHPGLTIEIACRSSRLLARDLRERRLDVALLASAPEEEGVEAECLMSDDLVLIVAPDHRLAGVADASVADLADELVIVEGLSTPAGRAVTEAFARQGTRLQIGIESTTIETIKRVVARRLGVGFVPRLTVGDEVRRGELAVVTVRDFAFERTLWIARRAGDAPTAAAAAFGGIVKSVVPKLVAAAAEAACPVRRPRAVIASGSSA
ncbi:MAG: LysR family transcriptional regulator [Blastocatellia bacterium]|jgi:DNA-binding transcriptional LysR family regulator|nr:LysR family transcriptional regulator [Blastocatellia bacterium]MBK6426779.1 LysR family transcriptional regulator [Blastocatellia bacterium]